jgi:hypothetical protein
MCAQELSLRDAFFNITSLSTLGVDPIIKYLSTDRSQEIDTVRVRPRGVCAVRVWLCVCMCVYVVCVCMCVCRVCMCVPCVCGVCGVSGVCGVCGCVCPPVGVDTCMSPTRCTYLCCHCASSDAACPARAPH